MPSKKPWGGRFKEATHSLVERYTESVSFDKRLYPFDIQGSIAHAEMLAKQGIISKDDAQAIIKGLESIKQEADRGAFNWDYSLEDVHMNIEAALTQKIGEAGGRLHTARSRNDQVATSTRLFLKDQIKQLDKALKHLQQALITQAETYQLVPMPGFTHLQHAQPILWSHYMMAFFDMFKRDRERLRDSLKRVDLCPLGAAALAGTDFPVDRMYVARKLGFSGITSNSLDSVADRDFIAEFIFVASMIMVHLSRLSEDLIIWNSPEFAFVKLPDRFCTGSSIMPQKKNPDIPELVRGKTGRVIGDLVAILTCLKGLPMSYNRDLQEDKEALFDACDTCRLSVEIMAKLLREIIPIEERLQEVMKEGFLTATDLADYLVERGLPFRQAHEVVGKVVGYCIEHKKELWDLEIEELRAFSPLIDEDCFNRLTITGSIEARDSLGGTASTRVKEAVEEAKRWMDEWE